MHEMKEAYTLAVCNEWI